MSLRLPCLFAAAICATAAEPASEPKLPPAATAAVDALQREIGKDYAAYHAAVQKAAERATRDLQRAMADTTKKGDLATATAIKALLDDLAAGKLQDRLEAQVKPDVDLLGDVPPGDDSLHAALAKGDWILDRNGNRALLRFEHWGKGDDAAAHWTCTVAPDVGITLLNGIRLAFRSPGLGWEGEFTLDPKTGRLAAANGWVIRHPAANEDLPETLADAGAGDPGPSKIRIGRRHG